MIEDNKKLLDGLYRFSTSIYDEESRTRKYFVREVRVLQMHFPKNWVTYKFYCKRFIFDDKQTTVLMRKVASIFSVLSVRVDLNGTPILIDNMEQLQSKWNKTKVDLQRNHQGEVFENYMLTIEETINNQEKLLAFVSNNKMLGLFFKHLCFIDSVKNENYILNEIKNRKVYTNTFSETQGEKFIFQNEDFIEAFIKQNNTQYELLWIG